MRNLTLVEWILLAVLLLTGVALVVPAAARTDRHKQLVGCRNNLKTMFQAAQAAPPAPETLGVAYWTRLPLAPEALRCPLVPSGIVRDCDYLGPSKDPTGLGPEEPIGCDMADNHLDHGRRGGNVLYKSGEVKTLNPRDDSAWADPWREASLLKCRP